MHRRALVAVLCVAFAFTAAACDEQDRWPRKPSDFVSLEPPNSWKSTHDTVFDDAVLVGPHFSVRFTRLSVLTAVEQQHYRAAFGHELLLLVPGNAPLPAYPRRTEDELTASVVVDGAVRPLPKVPEGGLVVSVPTGHGATLRITDVGRTQSLELRTGVRPDAVPGFYRPTGVTVTGTAYSGSGTASYQGTRADVGVSLSAKSARGALLPWTPTGGWAATGRIWLRLSGLELRATTGSTTVTYAVDVNTAFSLSGAVTLRPQPPFDTVDYRTGFTFALTFEVPDAFAAGSLAFQPVGQFFGPTERVFQPGSTALPFVWSKPLPAARPFQVSVAG